MSAAPWRLKSPSWQRQYDCGIITMVEEAQSQRAPSQQYVDKFARYYTPWLC
jgi:cation transport ATPase